MTTFPLPQSSDMTEHPSLLNVPDPGQEATLAEVKLATRQQCKTRVYLILSR